MNYIFDSFSELLFCCLKIGKHEAIVKNVHDLLAKLAWDFSAEQLDHLFSRFQVSDNTIASKFTELFHSLEQ